MPLLNDPELQERWTTRLRDPESKQAQRKLRDDDGGFCCLGHLADIIDPEGWVCLDNTWTWHGEWTLLPTNEARSLGFSNDANYDDDDFEGKRTQNTYSGFNDEGYTFLQIADAIEAVK